MLELKAPRSGTAEAVVVEAHMEKGLGPVATVGVDKCKCAVFWNLQTEFNPWLYPYHGICCNSLMLLRDLYPRLLLSEEHCAQAMLWLLAHTGVR